MIVGSSLPIQSVGMALMTFSCFCPISKAWLCITVSANSHKLKGSAWLSVSPIMLFTQPMILMVLPLNSLVDDFSVTRYSFRSSRGISLMCLQRMSRIFSCASNGVLMSCETTVSSWSLVLLRRVSVSFCFFRCMALRASNATKMSSKATTSSEKESWRRLCRVFSSCISSSCSFSAN